ncbi:MAG: hypothetical protein ACREAA_20515 [Candidatus Polarisedimenticolia bacterium]
MRKRIHAITESRYKTCILLAVVLLSSQAFADDLAPPAWRGAANTTFQHWHFPPINPGGPAPDASNNPFGQPGMEVGGMAEWRNIFQGRVGVWQLLANGLLTLFVPNKVAQEEKQVWIQVTYHFVSGSPNVMVTHVGGGPPFALVNEEIEELGDGWAHLLSVWQSPQCGPIEKVELGPNAGSGVAYIDQVVIDTICAPASGSVPDGDTAGEIPLTAAPAAGGQITLAWSASCSASDNDYEIYEGTIGTYYSHTARICTTGGATTSTFTPATGDTYYIVVPHNALLEGSYGHRSDGSERPQGLLACLPKKIAVVCP